MNDNLANEAILQILNALNAALSQPVWLFGGVAVDFLVGRWTRPHHDIDLNAYCDSRQQLTLELNSIGLFSADQGWLTNWAKPDGRRVLEVVFMERGPDHSGVLAIPAEDVVGAPGRVQTLPGYLDPDRFAELDGVRFRVCSPAGEWLARMRGSALVAGRVITEPKVQHDLRLLEGLLTDAEMQELYKIVK